MQLIPKNPASEPRLMWGIVVSSAFHLILITVLVGVPSWYRPELAQPKSTETTALLDGNDSIMYLIGTGVDGTEKKRLELEWRNMLSMFAHDMKNAVLTSEGFLMRLISNKAGAVTKRQQDYLEIIRDELTQLSQFIADFLEFARLEANAYKPLLAPCDIQAEIRKSVEAVTLEAQTG